MAESVGDQDLAALRDREKRGRLAHTGRYLRQHQIALWWLHSAWAFLFGLAMMLLGASKPGYVRLVIFHLLFIWLSSLFLPVILRLPWVDVKWSERFRLVINYLNKNFYQQLLFFVIPIYYGSTTLWSRNVLFLALVALSAVLSTLDIVYDRYLSVRWPLTALYLSFSAFASLHVMLLILWTMNHQRALYLSALGALVVFASMLYRYSGFRGPRLWKTLAVSLVPVMLLVHFGRGFVPPATLSLGEAAFGHSVQKLQIVQPLSQIPITYEGRLAVMTPIKAPWGLVEEVRHLWYLDGKVVYTSNKHRVQGGRKEGYRFWSSLTIRPGALPDNVRVDVETGSGQLIGRACISRAGPGQ
jgi:hypothetical protein